MMKKEFKAALKAATSNSEVVGIVNDAVALDAPEARPPRRRSPLAVGHHRWQLPPPRDGASGERAAGTVAPRDAVAPRQGTPTSWAWTRARPAAYHLHGGRGTRGARLTRHTITVGPRALPGRRRSWLRSPADGVIFAHDPPVRDIARFAGRPPSTGGSSARSPRVPALILGPKAAERRPMGGRPETGGRREAPCQPRRWRHGHQVDASAGLGTRIRQTLMTGVSYIDPVCCRRRHLIALGSCSPTSPLGQERTRRDCRHGFDGGGQLQHRPALQPRA